MAVEVIDKIKPKNGGSFPIVEAVDVEVSDGVRLPEALARKAAQTDLEELSSDLTSKASTSDLNTATANLQGQINQIEISATAEAVVAPEVAAARVGVAGVEYSTLKERIDADDVKLSNGIQDCSPIKELFDNLLNPNTIATAALSYYANTRELVNSTTSKAAIFPCKPNTKYTLIQTKTSARFGAYTTAEYPANHTACNIISASPYTSPKEITTGATDKYIAIVYFESSLDTTYSESQHLNSCMVAEGTYSDNFVEYGKIRINPEMLTDAVYNTVEGKVDLTYDPLTQLFTNKFNYKTADVKDIDYYAQTNEIVNSTSTKCAIVPCEPNTTYTIIEGKTSERFSVFTTTDYPVYHTICNSASLSPYTSPKEITTGATDNYIVIKFYNSGVDTTYTPAEHLETIMVAEGEASEFVEYGKITVVPDMIENGVYDVMEGRVDMTYKPLTQFYVNKIDYRTAQPVDLDYYVGNREIITSIVTKSLIVPCKPNTKYSIIETKTSGRFSVFTTTDMPANHVSVNTAITAPYTSPIHLTTGENDRYIMVKFYNSGVDTTYTVEEHLKTVMVAEGDYNEFVDYGVIAVTPDMLVEKDDFGDESVYGISIHPDGTVSRIGKAANKTNDYVIGNSFVHGGDNFFDAVYPWSEIKVCNLNTDSYGDPVVTYEYEDDFARDGSNGSVYVEIPKFYSKRYYDESGNDIWLISGQQYGGFNIEPVFVKDDGTIADRVYVGAYLTQTGVDVLNSISGVFPSSNESLEDYREKQGEMYDYATLIAIQKLMAIEFGAVNLSPVFGGFSDLPWATSCRADGSATNTNTGNFKGDNRLENLNVGSTVTVSDTLGQIQNRTITYAGEVTTEGGGRYRQLSFDGDPVDLTDNITAVYCTGQKTGFTDNLPYHTGRTNLNSGSTLSNQFKYRGIEGLWGTLGEIMDGIIVKDLKMYYTNKQSDYGDITKYKRFNFDVPLQNTYTNSPNPLPPQIKKMGLDFRYPTITFPVTLTALADSYFKDLFFSIDDTSPDGQEYPEGTEFIGISSMAWDGKNDNGLFTLRFWATSATHAWLYGSRAVIRSI